MFFGESRVSIDEKGRMSIPTEHRAQLAALCAGQLVLTYNPYDSGCLLVFPKPDWERTRDAVMKLNTAQRAHRDLQRRLVGAAAALELDSAGRITLPHGLRLQVGLSKQGVLIGLTHKFELWSEASYQNHIASPIADGDITQAMQELPL
jgi:MraZ protein